MLGAILVNNEAMDRVSSFLEPHHFFDPLHQQIFETAAKLIHAGKNATPITLRTFFERAEPISPNLTVPQYLGTLAANATTIINAEDYGRTVYDLATRRALIIIGEDMVTGAYDSPVDFTPQTQIQEAETRLYDLAEQRKYGQGFLGFGSALTNAIDMANAAFQRSGHLSGLATGLTDLDAKLGGLQPSDLIILAGRPSMGKTALATNIAYNIAKQHKVERQTDGSDKTVDGAIVGFFSLEMSAEQLATRILSEQTEISSEKIRRGMIKDDEFSKLVLVSQTMSQIPLYIDQTGGISIAQLAARARKLKRQKGLGLLVVDYLQLLTGHKRLSDGRVQEVSEITTGLKALAKELNVPIIALSQLSRQVEQRDDKRPQLSDLRESGSIEQDADVVMFVFREEYYVERRKPDETDAKFGEWMNEMSRVHGKAEVIIGKQRHGPTGTRATGVRRPIHAVFQPGAPPPDSRLRPISGLVCTAILRYKERPIRLLGEKSRARHSGSPDAIHGDGDRRAKPAPRMALCTRAETSPQAPPASSPSTSRRCAPTGARSHVMWRRPNARPSSRPTPTVSAPRRVIPALLDAGCRTFFVATLEEAHSARALAPGAAIYHSRRAAAAHREACGRTCARSPCSRASTRVARWVSLGAGARRAPPAALHARHRPQPPRPARWSRSLVLRAMPYYLRHLELAARHEPPRLCRRGRPSDEPGAARYLHAAARAAPPGALEPCRLRRPDARPARSTSISCVPATRSMAARQHPSASCRCVRSCASAHASCRCRTSPPGGRIGYSASYRAASPRRVATIAAGYADGVFRHASATNDAPGGAVSDPRQARADRRPRVHGPHHRRRDRPRRACAYARRLGRSHRARAAHRERGRAPRRPSAMRC